MWKIKLSNKQKHIQKRLYYLDYFSSHKHRNKMGDHKFPRSATHKSVYILVHMGKPHHKMGK